MIRTVPCSDFTCSVYDIGEGPVWLLVHGFPLDHSMWRFQLEDQTATRRTLAPDLRGFGSSGKGDAEPITMERLADDLALLLDQLEVPEPITICGLSMGGYVALAFWRRHRERLTRLVLCDTRAASDDETTRKVREVAARRVLKEGTESLVDAMIPKLFGSRSREESPELVRQVSDSIRRADPRATAAALRGMAMRRDMTSELAQIDLPVTVVVGAEDAITPPSEMEAMAAALPHAEFHCIEGAGHMTPLEAPEAFAQAVGW